MPKILEGENEKDFIGRCIPIVLDEGTAKDQKQAAAICYSMYREQTKENTQDNTNDVGVVEREHMYLDLCNDGAITLMDENKISIELDKPEENQKYEKYHAIAIRGDRFYKGRFLPATELMKARLDGTIHDINHMATTYDVDSFGNSRQNIEYEVGFQRGQTYHQNSKQLSTTVYIKKDAPKYQAWKNHVELCKELGKTPNLSISFYFNNKKISGREIPADVNLAEYGYNRDSLIPSIGDIDMQALSTVFKGACSDKDGCGIGIGLSNEELSKEQLIQKCIDDMKKQDNGMSDEEIRRACDIKINDTIEKGGDAGGKSGQGKDGGVSGLSQDIIIKKTLVELEIEKTKTNKNRRKK